MKSTFPNCRILAVTAAGSETAGWGYNSYGVAMPPSGTDFTTIAAGDQRSLTLRPDGSIALPDVVFSSVFLGRR